MSDHHTHSMAKKTHGDHVTELLNWFSISQRITKNLLNLPTGISLRLQFRLVLIASTKFTIIYLESIISKMSNVGPLFKCIIGLPGRRVGILKGLSGNSGG